MVAIRSFLILSAAVGIASAGKCKPESRSSTIVSVASSTVSASATVIESTTPLADTAMETSLTGTASSETTLSTASASATLIDSSSTLADTTVETSLTDSATESASSDTASASASASATLIESSTTLVDTTAETSIAESTASSATSADVSTTESKLTTFLTSFTTSNADTTTEAATTTTAAPGPVVSCPSDVDQCLGTMEIQCGVLLGGLNSPSIVADMNNCAQQCNSDTSCRAFAYNENTHECFIVTTQEIFAVDIGGWVSGIKGTCGVTTESSSTVFTSTAETTATEAATTTTAAAPPVDNCPPETGFCMGTSEIQCDVILDGLTFAGGGSITQCAQLCASDDSCTGFSRRRDDGACFTSTYESITSTEEEGWDSGISYSCAS
ncbi:hypothetical protein H9Q72_001810 [Fusarium xylarioides]|uniref:Apple domain-containing protein n=1 Tax=Fusarium xylarioides TaxID=221167 RepID=A0A9P7L9Z7_9HYPO|nr:hypothetical protein H9Q70_003154 [Fusarium xylarioides]KAG5771741.1 hypothetical protein H9Q72_001810 [Fusarium xylarioides]KAG5779862.1 hypothetical protein H9Q73_006477 [Fusarium xylarioides]